MPVRWLDNVSVFLLVSCMTHIIYGLRFVTDLSDIVAALDQPLLWNCEAQDDIYIVTYRWTFNGATLPVYPYNIIYGNGTLLIRKVSYDDVGTYLCIATAGETTLSSRPARLDIAYINPTFSIQPVSQSVILGDNVTLACYIESLPPAVVTWTLNGRNVSSGTVTQNSAGMSSLTMFPVMYYNVGTYKCVGTNPLNGVFRYSNDATLVVRGQPVFLSSLKPVSVPLGYKATFMCYFHGNPEPNVTWFVHYTSDDGSVSSIEIQTSDKYIVYDNGTFIINDVTEDDEAFYTCNVGNVFGEMSESTALTVTGAATPPEFTFRPSNNTIQQGDSVTFLCACSGNPEPKETWEKDVIIVSENGSLAISEVQSEDSGWYTCFCENDVGTVNQSVYLDVYTVPVITNPPADVAIKNGEPTLLHCLSTGNPSPSISWFTPRFDIVVTSLNGVTLHENGSLYITSATVNDTGDYTCLAKNIVGMVSAGASVTVKVAPEIVLKPLSQGVKVGSRVYLHCQATGVPDPIYSWSKDGEGMIVSSIFRQIYINNTLVIHSVKKQDEGVYRCLAGNNLGVTRAVATITVTAPPHFITVPDNGTLNVGSSIQLSCIVEGDPVPTQRWTKDDSQLVLDDNMELSLDWSVLTITAIRETQFGKYTCIASNIAGTESVSAWLMVHDIPVFIIIPEDTTVIQSATLSLQCQGQAIEEPSVTWYKGRGGEITQLMNDFRVTVLDNGYLEIRSVDAGVDEGWYTCIVGNSAGEISTDVYVDVQVPPKILSTNSPQSAAVQSDVILTCQSTGDPTPTLQWIGPSGQVISTSSTYHMIDNILRITSVSENDFGDWTCKSCSQLGCDMAVVQLNPEGSPTVESFTGVQDGSLVTIECTVQGNPTPSVTFTSQGQSVTSALQGHLVRNNRILIEAEFLKSEYRCLASNVHGTTFKTITVPSKLDPPSAFKTETGTVTLSWKAPVGQSNLPLTGYSVQMKSNLDVSWQPVDVQGHDLLNQRSLKVTGLESNRGYVFRVAARNLLGLGEYSDMSSRVQTHSAAPSPPQDVLALQVDDSVYILTWEKSKNLNAPIADVVYKYRVVKPVKENSGGTAVIHTQGTITYDQPFQVEIAGLTEPVVYKLSIWAWNKKLNQSSEPFFIDLDMTSFGILKPPAAHSDNNSSLGRDQVIAIVAGSFGGIIVVIIIVLVVTRARNHRKSKSLSLMDQRLSLDQFYMENPKTLYNDDKYSSKRKSGTSFYSFDESFQSTMGSRGRHDGSVEILGSKQSNDVLLLSRNPLYTESEVQSPVSQTSRKDKPYKENIQETACVQGEIEIQDCDVTIDKGVVNDQQSHEAKRVDSGAGEIPLSTKNRSSSYKGSMNNLDDDVMVIYYSSNHPYKKEEKRPDESVEHIYTSIHSADSRLSDKGTSSSKSDNSGQRKPLLRVRSPDQQQSSVHSVAKSKLKENSVKSCDKLGSSHRDRCTRSASPSGVTKGSDLNKPKPPIRVLSLDLMSPSVKVDNEKDKDLKLLSEGMVKRKGNIDKRMKAKGSDPNKKRRSKDCTIEKRSWNGCHDPDEISNIDMNSGEIDGVEEDCKDIELTPLKASAFSQRAEMYRQDYEAGIHNGSNRYNTLNGENGEVDPYEGNIKQRPKRVLDDNFLTETEVKKQVVSAALY